MRVVHKRAAALDLELIDEGLSDGYMRLRHAADAVHAIRDQHAVPMNSGVLRQLIGDEDAYFVALDHLDSRPWCLAVVAPQLRSHAGSNLARHLLGDEVE